MERCQIVKPLSTYNVQSVLTSAHRANKRMTEWGMAPVLLKIEAVWDPITEKYRQMDPEKRAQIFRDAHKPIPDDEYLSFHDYLLTAGRRAMILRVEKILMDEKENPLPHMFVAAATEPATITMTQWRKLTSKTIAKAVNKARSKGAKLNVQKMGTFNLMILSKDNLSFTFVTDKLSSIVFSVWVGTEKEVEARYSDRTHDGVPPSMNMVNWDGHFTDLEFQDYKRNCESWLNLCETVFA